MPERPIHKGRSYHRTPRELLRAIVRENASLRMRLVVGGLASKSADKLVRIMEARNA